MEYTIRNMEDGGIICRGYFAESEEGAVKDFVADHPHYSADDVYAVESNWND